MDAAGEALIASLTTLPDLPGPILRAIQTDLTSTRSTAGRLRGMTVEAVLRDLQADDGGRVGEVYGLGVRKLAILRQAVERHQIAGTGG
jgi:hypothetical protein